MHALQILFCQKPIIMMLAWWVGMVDICKNVQTLSVSEEMTLFRIYAPGEKILEVLAHKMVVHGKLCSLSTSEFNKEGIIDRKEKKTEYNFRTLGK